jgi:outer membrane protein OmpA-like peptidoglycan-associated protein
MKDQVKDFKEDQLEVFKPKKLSGRANRQMTIYYNVINILGDRMGKNPNATVKLTGSSMEGVDDGLAMAESIRRYLTSIFGIDPSRINTEGRIKPRIPSEQPDGVLELELLREGDRRVSISSESPAILEEFQSGPTPLLKPMEVMALQYAPPDSYVAFDVKGGKEPFYSWSLEIRDKNDKVQYFGPYYSDKASIPGKTILGDETKGDFKITMIGLTKDGKTIKRETTTHIVLWKPSAREMGLRFSVIFEFNESNTIALYDKYLTEVVTPKIPKNATVIIHGHTDIIGEEAYNLNLSTERANKVGEIIKKALANKGRTDVTMEIKGFGEDQILAPFENKTPEERFYNRTVIIDIIPRE